MSKQKLLTATEMQELLAKNGFMVEDYNIFRSRKHKGAYVVRRGFFYRHGRTVDQMEQQLEQALPGASVIEAEEHYNTWPKDSYWEVIFRYTEPDKPEHSELSGDLADQAWDIRETEGMEAAVQFLIDQGYTANQATLAMGWQWEWPPN